MISADTIYILASIGVWLLAAFLYERRRANNLEKILNELAARDEKARREKLKGVRFGAFCPRCGSMSQGVLNEDDYTVHFDCNNCGLSGSAAIDEDDLKETLDQL